MKLVDWILRLLAAAILLQTLYFKFTAAPESIDIFTQLGAEPWGRLGTGALELVTALLLLIPSTVVFGAILGVGLMAGAIGSHLLVLGIVVGDDGGTLFMLASTVFVCSLFLVYLRRGQIPVIGRRLSAKS